MGNKAKRAKRAKLKAKQARTLKSVKQREYNDDLDMEFAIPDSAEAFFKTLPHPENHVECAIQITKHINETVPSDQLDELDSQVIMMTTAYHIWHAKKTGVKTELVAPRVDFD